MPDHDLIVLPPAERRIELAAKAPPAGSSGIAKVAEAELRYSSSRD